MQDAEKTPGPTCGCHVHVMSCACESRRQRWVRMRAAMPHTPAAHRKPLAFFGKLQSDHDHGCMARALLHHVARSLAAGAGAFAPCRLALQRWPYNAGTRGYVRDPPARGPEHCIGRSGSDCYPRSRHPSPAVKPARAERLGSRCRGAVGGPHALACPSWHVPRVLDAARTHGLWAPIQPASSVSWPSACAQGCMASHNVWLVHSSWPEPSH